MRISTRSIYETATNQINTLQSGVARTQMQLSTQRRNLTPSDDPIASARALEVTQSQSINTQLATNRQTAKSSLAQVDQALDSVTLLIQDVQDLVVAAGNGSLTDADRATHATELAGRIDDLVGLANTTDANGTYMFSGSKTGTPPFARSANGATYNGDQGQHQLQVGPARQLAINASGSSVFEGNITGNGNFTTAADPGNYARGGSGIITPGSVSDASQLTGHTYELNFSTASSYTITDTSVTPPVPGAEQPYVSGTPIAVGGMQFNIKGSPVAGDQFTAQPSKKESMFTTLTDLLGVLRAPGSGAAGQAALTNGLNTAHNNLDSAYNNVLSVRATTGASLKELDYLDSAGDDLKIQYASTLGDLEGLDTVQAMSLFTQQNMALQASQKSFTIMSGLSLFNYIS